MREAFQKCCFWFETAAGQKPLHSFEFCTETRAACEQKKDWNVSASLLEREVPFRSGKRMIHLVESEADPIDAISLQQLTEQVLLLAMVVYGYSVWFVNIIF